MAYIICRIFGLLSNFFAYRFQFYSLIIISMSCGGLNWLLVADVDSCILSSGIVLYVNVSLRVIQMFTLTPV